MTTLRVNVGNLKVIKCIELSQHYRNRTRAFLSDSANVGFDMADIQI